MVNTILFDLDGTLLPMDQEEFIKLYFKGLYIRFKDTYDFETLEKTIWAGTKAMVENDGSKSNETVFWETANKLMSLDRTVAEPEFYDFYENDFIIAKGATTASPIITGCIHRLKEKGYTIVAATNPLFPGNATRNRLRWAGFNPDDFALITTYEDSHYCKPNIRYYEEILGRLNKKPAECIMVGNDNQEDMCAETIGIKGHLITDCLINRGKAPITAAWQGTFEEFSQLY